MFKLIPFIVMTSMHFSLIAQVTIPLYDGNIPGSVETPDHEKTTVNPDGITVISGITKPTISIYKPQGKKGPFPAIIIFPGGGYWVNAIEHEGYAVAKKLAENGVAAFVVKYRIPDNASMTDKKWGPLQDAQQALSLVRSMAKEWQVDPHRVGVMGFSAGGHLASTVSTHYRHELVKPGKYGLRPDFTILIYPVVSFSDSIGHMGSRDQLIGKNPPQELIDEFSNEKHVDGKTPPAFLAHAKNDPVSYRNSLVYDEALEKNHVEVRLLLFDKGGHGFGMYNKESSVQWPEELLAWLKKMKFLK